jgi:hypothetical protein
MHAKFPQAVEEKILAAAKEIWEATPGAPSLAEVRLGRVLFTAFHCKARMVQIKCFRPSDRPGYVKRAADVFVCPVCLAGHVQLHDLY